MTKLDEKLSEFSYGYGVTRELEDDFGSSGLRAVPFFPSLFLEGELGYDVRLDRPGQILFLQFKLGKELQRFRRTYPAQPVPALNRPFWRFFVDLNGGQFRHLKSLEDRGGDVFYVAPRFSEWSEYQAAYFSKKIMDWSLKIRPSEILRKARGASSSEHRVVYDKTNQHVCSEPVELEQVQWAEVVEQIARKIRDPDAESLRAQTERLLNLSIRELRNAMEQIKDLGSLTALGDHDAQHAKRLLLGRLLNPRLLETQALCITAAEPT